MADLLLHSLEEFDEIIFELLERLTPRSLLEVGSETGQFSKRLMQHCESRGLELITVEPTPAPELMEFARESAWFHLIVGLSVPYLAEHGCRSDFVLVDGDHNYFTVTNELRLIHESWAERRIEGVILLHDVGFPCARRDFYYDPMQVPDAERHPYSFERGVTLDSTGLIEGGFRGAGHFAWAEQEGGPKNGVLSAVEDFVAEHPEYAYHSVDAVFGLGALCLRASRHHAVLSEVFGRYDTALIRRLERNRLELYLKVIELQDKLNAADTARRA